MGGFSSNYYRPTNKNSSASPCPACLLPIVYNYFMEPFILDPDIKRFPPEAVRILSLRATPYPGGNRLRIAIELTPFLKKPNIELELVSPEGISCGSTSLVESMGWILELTMHVRPSEANIPLEQLSLTAVLSYPGLGEIDRHQITFPISNSKE
jgi:hypothetical protein